MRRLTIYIASRSNSINDFTAQASCWRVNTTNRLQQLPCVTIGLLILFITKQYVKTTTNSMLDTQSNT